MIETIQPVFGAVAAAAVEQNSTTSELARNAAVSSQFVTAVADGAIEIEQAAAAASGQSDIVDRSSISMVQLASELKTRFTIFLRQTEIGDRRRHDRLPCEIAGHAAITRAARRAATRSTSPRAACWRSSTASARSRPAPCWRRRLPASAPSRVRVAELLEPGPAFRVHPHRRARRTGRSTTSSPPSARKTAC